MCQVINHPTDTHRNTNTIYPKTASRWHHTREVGLQEKEAQVCMQERSVRGASRYLYPASNHRISKTPSGFEENLRPSCLLVRFFGTKIWHPRGRNAKRGPEYGRRFFRNVYLVDCVWRRVLNFFTHERLQMFDEEVMHRWTPDKMEQERGGYIGTMLGLVVEDSLNQKLTLSHYLNCAERTLNL